jgi:nitrate reductase gamma subunit/mono/diheme cytochrome c family protein
MSPRLMTQRLSTTIFVGILLRALLATSVVRADEAEAKKIFTQRCMACHTFGKGVKVGPDLKGVTERRERPWLLRFVRSSQTVIREGDPIANALFAQFKQQQMPDWTDLTEPQISSLLDWFAIDGPEQRDPSHRPAADASVAEVERGRSLFLGRQRFSAGGLACASCHAVADDLTIIGASLAVDLSSAYREYQDGAMSQILLRPCSQRLPESLASAFLTPEESYALKAYLRSRAIAPPERSDGGPAIGAAKAIEGEAPTKSSARSSVADRGARRDGPGAQPRRWSPHAAAIGTAPRGHAPASGTWVFAYLPYGAIALFAAGMLLRWIGVRRREPSLAEAAATASQRYRGSRPWWIGIGAVFLIHLLILLTPQLVVWWGGAPWRLYALEATGWLAGLLAFGGWAQMSWRYLGQREVAPGQRARELGDALVLSTLGVALCSGLIFAVADRWASLWATATLTPYVRSLPSGAPIGGLVEQMPLLVRLHVLAWFALLAVLPTSRVADLLIYAVDRVASSLARPLDAGLHALARVKDRVNVARWIWPDEDAEPAAKADADPVQPQP